MNNEMQNVTVSAMTLPEFKNAELAKAAREILKAGENMASQNVKIATVLGRVKKTRCFVQDGFKSVEQFANEVFGIGKASAYKMAQVGERFYNEPTETAQKAAAILSTSNLAEVLSMDDEQLSAAIDSGKISMNSKQKELREAAKAEKPVSEGEPLKRYKITGFVYNGIRATELNCVESLETLPAFLGINCEYKFINAPTKDASGNVTMTKILVSNDGTVAVFTAEYVKPSKSKKPKYTVEQLRAMLAEAEGAEG